MLIKAVLNGLFLRYEPRRDAIVGVIDSMLFHRLQVTGILGFRKEFLVSLRIILHSLHHSFVFLFPAFDGNIKKKLFSFHREQSENGVGF